MKRGIFSFLLSCLFAFSLTAQTSKGFIVGNISDQTGAAVPNATVIITNVATGVKRQTVSRDDGQYRLDAVDPGTYNIEISSTGFGTSQKNGVVVSASQTADVPVVLSVSGTTATVDVTVGSNVELQTTDGTRSSTFETKQITELPIPNLNPTNLVFTMPGVVDISQTSAGGFAQGTEFSVNGLRGRANNQLVDGLDNNDNSITGQNYQPTVRDGYSEVAILQSNYSAEFGRAGGAIVNVVTRSGTNRFHGSIYDIIQNSSFNSLTPGEKTRGLTKVPQFSDNNFGFSLGGPIIKNKVFFFGTFQANLIRNNSEATAIIPTAAGYNTLRGLAAPGANANLDYYLGIIGDRRGATNPFLISLGNGRPDVEVGTISQVAPQPVDTYDYISRVDYTPTSRDSLSFRYLATKQSFINQFPTVFPGYEVDVPSLTQNFFASYTKNFSSNITNEFRFGFGSVNVGFDPRNEAVGQSGAQISFGGLGLGRGLTGVGLSPSFPQGRAFKNYQFQDTITYTTGDHTFRVGADLNVQRANQRVPFNSRGTLAFTDSGNITALGNFIDGFTGGSGSVARVFGDQTIFPNAFYQNYFINDEWRIRRNLTLNLGLRYENYGAPYNSIAFPAFAGFGVPIDTIVKQKRDNNNFAPRVSFAYSPEFEDGLGKRIFGENNTVIRGGFAVNYDVFFNNILSNTAAASPNVRSFLAQGQTSPDPRGRVGSVSQLPTDAPFSTSSAITSIEPNLVNPQSFVYNLGIQRRFAKDYIFDIAYVGSRGTRLFITEQINPLVNGARLNSTRGSVQLRTNGGDSNYNSMQLRVERGYKNGFLLRGTYTFSKAIDNVGSEVFATTGGTSLGSNAFNRAVDRSLASFDVPHTGTISSLIDVPTFGTTGILKKILGGFTLSGIYRIQSGAVQTAFVNGFDLNGDGSSLNDRPVLYNPNAPANSVAIRSTLFGIPGSGYVNANGDPIDISNARYVVDRALRNGIVGRNTLRGPRFSKLDMSLQRSFGLSFIGLEQARFEIRADFFNILNNPSFLPGTGDVTDTTFNDPFTFGEGSRRTGRIQLRFAF